MHSNRQCYGRIKPWGKGRQHCVGDLRSYLHGVTAGQRPGWGDIDGWCGGSRRESAQMEASVGFLDLQKQVSEVYEAENLAFNLVNNQ